MRAQDEMDGELRALIPTRVHAFSELEFPRLMQLIAWDFMEKYIFSKWFPGLREYDCQGMAGIETRIRLGGRLLFPMGRTCINLTQPDKSNTGEKTEYWKAYTKSLLFQNPTIVEDIHDVKPLSDRLFERLYAMHDGQVFPVQDYRKRVQKSLVNARILAAQMGCQRNVYQIDDDVCVGSAYDDSRMMDDKYTVEEDGEGTVVRCILSRGWVKRARVGDETAVPIYICKARVLVGFPQD